MMNVCPQPNLPVEARPLGSAAEVERRIAEALTHATQELARIESLDEEQRSEIYAILAAIQADTRMHGLTADAIDGVALMGKA